MELFQLNKNKPNSMTTLGFSRKAKLVHGKLTNTSCHLISLKAKKKVIISMVALDKVQYSL